MTIEEALKILSGPYKIRGGSNEPTTTLYFDIRMVELFDALNMAIDALRAKQKAEKNKPLTLEELRQMDGQPVFIEHDIFPKFNHVWMIWSNQVSDDNQDGLEGYGDFWRAYRRPPVKEGT